MLGDTGNRAHKIILYYNYIVFYIVNYVLHFVETLNVYAIFGRYIVVL